MRDRLVGTLAVAVAVGACVSTGSVRDPGSPTTSSAPRVPYLSPAWRLNLADTGFLLRYRPTESTAPVPRPDGLGVIVGTSDGAIRSVAVRDGAIGWTTRVGAGVQGRIQVDGDRVFAASDDGFVVALDLMSGAEVWRYRAGGALAAGPVVAQGRVLFVTDAERIRVLDADDGRWLWDYGRDPPDRFVLAGASTPKVVGDRVIVGFADGTLTSLALEDGAVVWGRDLTAGEREFTDVDSDPCVIGDRVFTASWSGGLYAIDLDTGEVVWRNPLRAVGNPAPDGDRIWVPASDGALYAVAVEDGRTLLARRITEEGTIGKPIRVGSWWAVATTDRGVLLFDPDDGSIVQRLDGGDGVSVAPTMVGRTVVVLSNGGYLYGYRAGG